jgi:hypothetical protein
MLNIDILGLNERFANKVVSFGTNIEDTLAIKNPVLELQHDKLFLVGIVPQSATTNNWAQDRACALLWESVTDYIVFDNEEQFVQLMGKSIVD